MAWPRPQITSEHVNQAVETLRVSGAQESPKEYFEAIEIIDGWRTGHSYPLSVFRGKLRSVSHKVDPNAIVVQRLKRFPSIESKLTRFPELELTEIQDIGGCRAIVSTVSQVYDVAKFFQDGGVKHVLYDQKDYIALPRSSGYRGCHLMYSFNGTSKHSEVFTGLDDAYYYLLLSDAFGKTVELVGFKKSEVRQANIRYEEIEKELKTSGVGNAVLVSVDKLSNLKRAYPNYYSDASEFVKTIEAAIAGE